MNSHDLTLNLNYYIFNYLSVLLSSTGEADDKYLYGQSFDRGIL